MQAYRKDFPVSELNGQFDKLTDRTEETLVPELAEGAVPKQYIYTVAHASGSESSVLIPCLCFCLFPWNSVLIRGNASSFVFSSFRVSASAYFREIPC